MHVNISIACHLFVCFRTKDIDYLKTVLPPDIEPDFFEYLLSITADDISLSAIDEGTVVFPRVPLIVVEGSLVVTQLLETLLLNLINYARSVSKCSIFCLINISHVLCMTYIEAVCIIFLLYDLNHYR